MRFLVDAQLPTRLARRLTEAGHDASHTSDLPAGNRTTDQEVARIADSQQRIVVSKDGDFRDGHVLRGVPAQLLIVRTGNISNQDLLALFDAHIDDIAAAFAHGAVVELNADRLIVLESP